MLKLATTARLVLGLGLTLGPLASAFAKSSRSAGSRERSGNGIFQLASLPRGKNITIPRPATTHVGLNQRVQLTATDMPQSISLVPVHSHGGALPSMRVAIFDKHADRVTYAEIKPGTPFVYAFQAIDPIILIPEVRAAGASELQAVRLQIESDKPLEIAH